MHTQTDKQGGLHIGKHSKLTAAAARPSPDDTAKQLDNALSHERLSHLGRIFSSLLVMTVSVGLTRMPVTALDCNRLL